MIITTLSDKDLVSRFEYFGKMTLRYRYRVIGLLPEVAERKLYLRRGCASIFEYAKKVAGLSEEQTSRVLNIAPRLSDKPALRSLLEEGNVSVNKLARVVSIATVENEGELAERVQILSKSALETFVRDYRVACVPGHASAEVSLGDKPESESLFKQERKNIEVAPDVADQLAILRSKGFDIDQLLRELLAKREEDIQQKKDDVGKSLPEESGRYIPVRVKRVLMEEHGTKCAKFGCNKASHEIHHTARYGVIQSHDPHLLAPLCREHHELAHLLDVKYAEMHRR